MTPPSPPPPASSHHQDFLIEGLMPAREVSLIAGPSGVGKTTLLVQVMEWFRAGGLVFGRQAHPAPLVYVTCDRSQASFKRSLDRHQIAHDAFPWEVERKITTVGEKGDRMKGILKWMNSKHPEARLLCLDGMGSLVPEGKISDYSIVAEFLKSAQFHCECYDITVLGTVHATKVKEHENYPNPRQRILGSVAWAAYTDLIVVIDPQDPDDPDSQTRLVSVLPRDDQEFTLKLENRRGVLVPFEEVVDESYFSVLEQEVAKFEPVRVLQTSEIIKLGEGRGIAPVTVKRWLSRATDKGVLERVAHGQYRRVSQA